MFGSKLVHFTEYSNIFPKMVVTGLAERYYWKGMSSELNTYIKTCHQCQHTNKNVKTTPAKLQPIPIEQLVYIITYFSSFFSL
jgi:hypothetical protein